MDPEVRQRQLYGIIKRVVRARSRREPAGIADEEARTTFSDGMELATRLGDERARVPLLALYGVIRIVHGTLAEGILLLEEGRDAADRIDDRSLRFHSRPPLGAMLVVAGRLEEAIAVFAEVEALCGGDVALGMDLYGFAPYVVAKAYHANALAQRGELEAALHLARGPSRSRGGWATPKASPSA